jgi:hypothetical protein
MEPCEFLNELEAEHRVWLSCFDEQYLRNWEKLRDADYEAAMTEASVRRILQRHGVMVEPNEDLAGSTRRPDFRCEKDGQRFYVEVTCVAIEKVVEETGLPHPTERGARHYSSLNDAFWGACKRKASQCGNLGGPAIVAVGTFHTTASVICLGKPHIDMLLTGETKLAWNIDMRTGSAVGDTYQITELRSAVFLRPDKDTEVGFARGSISALLVCGLGVEPPRTLGVRHPNPERPFPSEILPDIEFGEVEIDRASGRMQVKWPKGDDD